jgi:hypothetical protein
MSNTIRIKRRANGGGAGAPTSLANAELAYNEQTDILYYGKGTGGEGGTATAAEPISGKGAFVDLASTQDVPGAKTFTGTVNVPTPTSDAHAANKGYVDAVARGLDWKASVRVATGSNITLSGVQTIDGVSVVAGDRVLVRAQNTASANGIYTVVSGGAWTRADDFSATGGPGGAPSATAGATVFVSEGTTYGNTSWTCTTDDAITVGTTPITFSQIAGSGSETTAANVTPQVFGATSYSPYYQKVGNQIQFRTIQAGLGVAFTNPDPDTGYALIGLDDTVIRTTGDQNIGGTKTFTGLQVLHQQNGSSDFVTLIGGGVVASQGGSFGAAVTVGSPSQNGHAATKGYVDTQVSGKQNADATLTALAGVTTAANKLIYATGVDTFGVTDLSAFARGLLDDADAATARATLGLGSAATSAASAFQAADADLTAIAALAGTSGILRKTAADTWSLDTASYLTSVATANIANSAVTYAKIQNVTATDRLLGRSTAGAGVVEEIACTAAGRALLDDADAAAQRTTLGLGTAATQNSTAFQAADATLTALAGVTTAANKLVYATASDTFTTTDLSAFGRSLIDDADASTARSTLGLGSAATAASTAFQAADATLTALAGVTTAANKLVYATGADAFATTDLTSFARGFLDDADAATARGTLGLASMATQAANNVNITGGTIAGVTIDGGTF